MDIFDALYPGTQANQAAAQKPSELLGIQHIDQIEDGGWLKAGLVGECRALEGRVR